ncbi:meprin A subunit beta-like [Festucalex cinctus]
MYEGISTKKNGKLDRVRSSLIWERLAPRNTEAARASGSDASLERCCGPSHRRESPGTTQDTAERRLSLSRVLGPLMSPRMRGFILLLGNFLVSAASPTTTNTTQIEEIDEEKDIPGANKDLLLDDILPPPIQRSAISSKSRLWTLSVPYVLDNSLYMNAKGVTLRALEQFRLKSCIDFKVRDDELYFISVKKLSGCFSYVGRATPEGQDLSIGQSCDHIAIVEHEFLHALGFYHEQSREDRDDYVTIVFENIRAGREHNFRKVNGSITQGVPYDYLSVMHYGNYAFSNGKGSTIITKDPAFKDVIGQRLGMSQRDVQELNLLYNCIATSHVAFTAYCGFVDGDRCSMTDCSTDGLQGWQMATQAARGPACDHTGLSNFSSQCVEGGYFMHANITSGQEGDSAFLETPLMSPSRECHVQCLQFYYYHTGVPSDRLNIWIRDFTHDEDSMGHRRLVGQITGAVTSHWQIHHLSLNGSRLFQVEFEAVKGSNSSGGFSVDDISVSETDCPHNTLQLDDLENLLNSSSGGTTIYGPRRYTATGYAYRTGAVLHPNYVGVFIQLLNGTNDDELSWPCNHHQFTALMMDQEPSAIMRMSKQRSRTSDGGSVWDDPRKSGLTDVDENNQTAFTGTKIGWSFFATLQEMKSREFLKGGSLVLAFSFQDISPLVDGHVLPCPEVTPVQVTYPPQEDQEGPCALRARTTTPLPDQTSTIPTQLPDGSSVHISRPQTTADNNGVDSCPGMSSYTILVLLGVLMLVIP